MSAGAAPTGPGGGGERLGLGAGALPPRAWPASDARTLDLSGSWRFRLSPRGRFAATVEELQAPYLRPQENGNRRDVRWATIGDGHGNVIRLEGEPTFDLTVRPWTSEHLDQARHPTDLRPDGRVWVNLDHAQQGIGSASCGPGVLPAYRLDPAPATFAVRVLPRSA